MSFKIDEVPKEVKFVWAIEAMCKMYGIPVGMEIYEECQAIIKKYPEWFKENSDKPTK